AGGRERDARKRRRAGVRYPAGALRRRTAALPVTKKNPTRGGTPPRVGGRAKWPSHFGRDLIMAHPCTSTGREGFTLPRSLSLDAQPPILVAHSPPPPPSPPPPLIPNVSLCPLSTAC